MRTLIFIVTATVLIITTTAAHAQYEEGSNPAADPTAPVPLAPNATYGNTDPATPAAPTYPQPDVGTPDTEPGNCPSSLVNRGVPQEQALAMCEEIERGKNR